MDMVQNARFATDLQYVYELTLTLIQYGANPNVSVDMDDNESTKAVHAHGGQSALSRTPNRVLYYYVQLLQRKDHLLADPEQTFSKLIHLYHMAMRHTEVYTCLRLLHTQTGMVPAQSALNQCIKELLSKPRTLKQSARVVIYELIGRKAGDAS